MRQHTVNANRLVFLSHALEFWSSVPCSKMQVPPLPYSSERPNPRADPFKAIVPTIKAHVNTPLNSPCLSDLEALALQPAPVRFFRVGKTTR